MRPLSSAPCDLLDQAGLEKLAAAFANLVLPGDVFLLQGPLGSGKSVFARAFLRALGVKGSIPSPTFIVDAIYSIGSLEVHHVDLYRLTGSHEELALYGIDQALDGEQVVLVEWADRLEDRRDGGVLIVLEYADEPMKRKVTVDDRRMARD